jgi:hypothetical protein
MWMIWTVLMGCAEEPQALITAPLVHETSENPLMRHVEWMTSQDVQTSLQVECDQSGAITLNESSPALEHLAYVGGLIEGESCVFWVTGDVGGVFEKSETTSITLGEMPSFIPGVVAELVPEESYGVLTTLARKGPESPGLVVIYDELGRPRWFAAPWGPRSPAWGVGVDLISAGMSDTVGPTAVLVSGFGEDFPAKKIAMDGRELWTLETVVHHQLTEVTSDLLVGLTYHTCDGVETNALTGFGLMDGIWQETWSWRTCENIAPAVASEDWDHLNAFDHQEGVVAISARNQDAIYGVDLSTRELLWWVGAGGDHVPTSEASFIGQHGVKLLGNGNVLMVDNGDDTRPSSRALEIALSDGEATVAWSADLGVYTPILGDIHRLTSGVTLIGLGQVTSGDSQILHLDSSGQTQSKLTIGDSWEVNRVETVTTMPFGAILDHALAWDLGI